MYGILRTAIIGLALLLLVAGCNERLAHERTVEEWHATRVERLLARNGWLSLTGLYWLEEGANTFGPSDANDLVFASSDSTMPPLLGTLYVRGGSVSARLTPGAEVAVDGVSGDSFAVASDVQEEPTLFRRRSLEWFVIEREGRLGVRLLDTLSQARTHFAGIERYPVEMGWRVRGRFVPHPEPRQMEVPTVLETTAQLPTPGAVEFDAMGETHRLDVVADPGDTRYWIMFADPTNRTTTYPAGRYLYIDAPDENGEVVIDFNMSYSPPCAFSDFATCPFPPPQNRLKVPVEAGEKRYRPPARLSEAGPNGEASVADAPRVDA